MVKAAKLAESLGIGHATLYELIRAGEMPAITIGRAIGLPARALEERVRDPGIEEASDRQSAGDWPARQ